MKNLRIHLRVVFYREQDRWVAHCLECDLCGDGDTREEAMESLWTAIGYQLEEAIADDNPLNLFTPADGKYFAMFAAGTDVAIAQLRLKVDSVEVNPPDVREYSGNDFVQV